MFPTLIVNSLLILFNGCKCSAWCFHYFITSNIQQSHAARSNSWPYKTKHEEYTASFIAITSTNGFGSHFSERQLLALRREEGNTHDRVNVSLLVQLGYCCQPCYTSAFVGILVLPFLSSSSVFFLRSPSSKLHDSFMTVFA